MADTPVLIRLLYSPILGLLMLAGAAYLIVEQNQFRASAAAVEGEVIELIKTSTQDHDDVLLPKVRYVDNDGQEKIFIADNEGFIIGYHAGQTVSVLYSEDGSDARLDDFTSVWAIPAITGSMGLLFTGFGIMLMRSRRTTEAETS